MSSGRIFRPVTQEEVLGGVLQYSIDIGDQQLAELICEHNAFTVAQMDQILKQNISENFLDVIQIMNHWLELTKPPEDESDAEGSAGASPPPPPPPEKPKAVRVNWFGHIPDVVRYIPVDIPKSYGAVLKSFIIPLHTQYKRLSRRYFQESDTDSSARARALSSLHVGVPKTFWDFNSIAELPSGHDPSLTNADMLGEAGDRVLMQVAFQFTKHRDLVRCWATRFENLDQDNARITAERGLEDGGLVDDIDAVCFRAIVDFNALETRKAAEEDNMDRFSLRDLDRICDWQGHALAKRIIDARVEPLMARGSME